jgi:transposase
VPPLDLPTLPKDVEVLQKIVVELCEPLQHESAEKDKYRSLLRELLEAQRNRKSEQLSQEPLKLFEELWKARQPEEAREEPATAETEGEAKPPAAPVQKRTGRQPLAKHLVRERIVHDLAEAEKHCDGGGKDLHLISEETSERYEYIPAQLKVIEDVRLKYACDCTVKTADKPSQPIEKSTAGASLLAPVIVSQFADHQPLHRQEKIFERHGVEISRKTMGGWMSSVADLLQPLYPAGKKVLFESKVIGTDDTGVKVLDRKLPFARTGRIWPYLGDGPHPVVIYDYTPTRGRDGPSKFLEGYQGYLQADAYSVYDAFFKPARGLIEVGCWMHARRYFIKAMDSDPQRRGARVVPHRAGVLYGGSRRRTQGGGEAGIAPAAIGSGDGEAAPVSAGDPRRGFREEPRGKGGSVGAQSVGGAEPLSERRRSGDRQWRHRAGQPGHRDWEGQLDVLRQRPGRQDGGRVAELHRDVPAERGRAVWLVLRCALANRYASD